jgi:type IV pilus assembly protein PilO
MTVTLAKTAAGSQNWTAKTRELLTLLNVHYVGVGLLVLVNVYLLIQIGFTWQAANSQDASALAQQTVLMKSAEVAARPLQGLDEKLKVATADADRFYERRLPFAYSEVLTELGALTKKDGVKLTRVQYAEDPVLLGGVGPLTEMKMDASLTGDYRPLVLFINGLERDKMFFLINGVTLVGQQTGTVGVRLRLTTYLRSPVGAESSEKTVATGVSDAGASADGGETR